MALLEVENLQAHFRTPSGINRAVDGVSFHVNEGETLAIVGESGCGKSVTSMSLMRLIPEPPGRIAGSIRFAGKDLLQLSDREMRAIRGNDISMIFQEPMTSLNPVLTVGRQIRETLMIHQGLDKAAAEAAEVVAGIVPLIRARAGHRSLAPKSWVSLTTRLNSNRAKAQWPAPRCRSKRATACSKCIPMVTASCVALKTTILANAAIPLCPAR